MRFSFHIPLTLLLALLPSISWGRDIGVAGSTTYMGEAVSGVYIEAFTERPETGSSPAGSTSSSENGEFTLYLPRGKYFITARKRPGIGTSAGMLYGTSGDQPVTVDKTVVTISPISLTDRGSVGKGPDSGPEVTGKVYFEKRPISGAFIYLYPEGRRRGPGYISRVRSGEGGRFTLRSSSGTYNITSRFGPRSEGLGSVRGGDLVGESANNPVRVEDGSFDAGVIELHRADPGLLASDAWASRESGLEASGVVKDEDGRPVKGIYAFLYRDYRMVGKPDAISAPTGEDGHFLVTAPGPGAYYLGVRSNYGGPVEPGELVGVYEKSGSRQVTLDPGENPASYEIVVKEVW